MLFEWECFVNLTKRYSTFFIRDAFITWLIGCSSRTWRCTKNLWVSFASMLLSDTMDSKTNKKKRSSNLRVPSSAHLGHGFIVPRRNSDRYEFDKTAAKIPYFHRKFDKKDVGRVLFNPACVGWVLERFLEKSFLTKNHKSKTQTELWMVPLS